MPPLTSSIPQPARYDELCALPESVIGEILDGKLVASPRPVPRHSYVLSILDGLLSGPFDRGVGGPGGWWILVEPEVHLDQHVVVPDLAGWRRERVSTFPNDSHFTIAPDWVCEVLSPSTVRHDRVTKLNIYLRFGVPHYWIIDPVPRTLEALRLDGGRWVLDATFVEDDAVAAAPFDALGFSLADLWPD